MRQNLIQKQKRKNYQQHTGRKSTEYTDTRTKVRNYGTILAGKKRKSELKNLNNLKEKYIKQLRQL